MFESFRVEKCQKVDNNHVILLVKIKEKFIFLLLNNINIFFFFHLYLKS